MVKSAATIVLVHGAWADGSSWNKVIPLLQAKHFPVIAVQIPLSCLEDDVAVTNRIVGTIEGPIILVGHSWGGMAVTQVGTDPKVAALVYVSAFAPDLGDTGSSLIGAHPTPPALSTVVTDAAGFVYQRSKARWKTSRPTCQKLIRGFWLQPGPACRIALWTNGHSGSLEDEAFLVRRDGR